MKTLVLWDIDLSLVDLRGMGGNWYRDALHLVAGVVLERMPEFGGRTERAITLELLAAHQLEQSDAMVRRMHDALVEIAGREYARLVSEGHALPGSAEALSALAGRADVVQSVVTGNLAEIARHKLTAFGLDTHVDFEIGGYGSLSEHRAELVTEAMRLAAAKHGPVFPAEAVVVIGDTPRDVEAALHHGAVAIAVATGGCTADELRDAGAHVVLTDLSDTDAVLSAVLGMQGGELSKR